MKNKNVIQTEGKAHNEDTAKVDVQFKPKITHQEKAKAKSEKKGKPQKAESVFPADGIINDYGFLHFRKAWLEDLGWNKGMSVKISKNADGSITLRKV